MIDLAITSLSLQEGDVTEVVATRNTATQSDASVTLFADPSQLSVPTSLVIPAGESSATFQLQAVENDIVDGTRFSDLLVTADRHTNSTQQFQVSDNDVAGFTVDETDQATIVNENGLQDILLLSLTSRPISDVTFQITHDGNDQIQVPSSVTFALNNWNQARSITISSTPDLIDDGDQEITFSLTVDPTTQDPLYAQLESQSLQITNQDNAVTEFRVAVESDLLRVYDESTGQLLQEQLGATQTGISTGSLDDQINIQALGLEDLVSVETGVGDDRITVQDIDSISLDGGEGFDRVRYFLTDADTLDLSRIVDRVLNVESIDVSILANVTNLTPQFVSAVTDESNTLRIVRGVSTVFDFGNDWVAQPPMLVDGRVIHTLVDEEATTLELVGGNDQSNPLNRFDVNTSGNVSSIDALLIVNQLGQAQQSESEDVFSPFYFDANASGSVTALDALQVINEIARLASLSALESESIVDFVKERQDDESVSLISEDQTTLLT